MSSHIIYHPKRLVTKFGGQYVYHDKTRANQDPYVWNNRFLHTYCHMSELRSPTAGDINFWVSGDRFPEFNQLFCDLVFVVEEVSVWANRNYIAPDDTIVDSAEAYNDHYIWASHEHEYKRRKRHTLKADSKKSFQPQDPAGQLIDIAPYLGHLGFSIANLRDSLRKGRGSKPKPLEATVAKLLYDDIIRAASTKLFGKDLQVIRRKALQLASPHPKRQ